MNENRSQIAEHSSQMTVVRSQQRGAAFDRLPLTAISKRKTKNYELRTDN